MISPGTPPQTESGIYSFRGVSPESGGDGGGTRNPEVARLKRFSTKLVKQDRATFRTLKSPISKIGNNPEIKI